MGPTDPAVVEAAVAGSPGFATYGTRVESRSAAEELAGRAEAGRDQGAAAQEPGGRARTRGRSAEQRTGGGTGRTAGRRRAPEPDDSLLEEVVKSSAFKSAVNTAARELVRSVFRRRR
jgi:hypothetical protein